MAFLIEGINRLNHTDIIVPWDCRMVIYLCFKRVNREQMEEYTPPPQKKKWPIDLLW